MQVIFQKKINLKCVTSEEIDESYKVVGINEAKFQMQYFLFKFCCCCTKLMKQKSKEKFEDLNKFYEVSESKLLGQITLGNYIHTLQ